MNKYEYDYFSTENRDKLISFLDDIGAQGWRVYKQEECEGITSIWAYRKIT